MNTYQRFVDGLQCEINSLSRENVALTRRVEELEHEMDRSVFAKRWREYKRVHAILEGRLLVGWTDGFGEFSVGYLAGWRPVFTIPEGETNG